MRARLLLIAALVTACGTAAPPVLPATHVVWEYPSPAAKHGGFSPAADIWLRLEGPALDTANLPLDFAASPTAPISVEAGGKLVPYRVTYEPKRGLLALHLRKGLGEQEAVHVRYHSSLRNVAGGPIERLTQMGQTGEFTYTTSAVQSLYAAADAASKAIRRVDAAPFTVFAPVALPSGKPVTALADRLPSFGWGIEAGGPDAPLTGLAAVVYGRVTLAAFRRADGTLPEDPARWTARGESVPFMLALPAEGALPHPVVVFGHGYTACKETLLGVAAQFAREGLALLAIDAVGHGERAGLNAQCGLMLTAGFGFDIVTIAGSFFDTIQQTRQLMALAPEIASRIDVAPADGAPDLAADAVGYLGQSMGAINGVAVASLEPRVKAAVINVGLGGIAASLFSRGDDKVPGAAFEPSGVLDVASSLDLAAKLYEPLNFIAGLAGKYVLVQQAELDELIPPLGSEYLALALDALQETGKPRAIAGLRSAEFPPKSPGGRHFRSVFADATHIFLIKNQGDATAAAQRQAARFLRTALSGGPLDVPATRP